MCADLFFAFSFGIVQIPASKSISPHLALISSLTRQQHASMIQHANSVRFVSFAKGSLIESSRISSADKVRVRSSPL